MATSRAHDLSGKRFGRLTVVERRENKGRNATWYCVCDCGGDIVTAAKLLKNGKSQSCKCLRLEILAKCKRKGGWNRLSPGESNRNSLYSRYKKDAGVRGYEFALDLDEFTLLTQGNCHFCGVPPSREVLYVKGTNGGYLCNGIDRINNTVGYILSNCVSCCKRCNQAKNDMSYEEFTQWISRIFDHLNL